MSTPQSSPYPVAASPEEVVAPKGLSLRSNFAWILGGNVAYAACQWGAIVALAKLGSSYVVGQFSLGLAIATPVLMFTNLHLRAVQATDALRLSAFREYLRLRGTMTLAGLAGILLIAVFGSYAPQTKMVILAVALAKAIESLSDIHYGLFQLNDRLDLIGRSLMLRGLLSVLALTVTLYFTGNIFFSCVALALVWFAELFCFDVRRARQFSPQFDHPRAIRPAPLAQMSRQWKLLRTALPMGFATTLAALNLNMPRYFIHSRLGEYQLGIYSAIAYTTVAMILVSDSFGHCAIPRLSRLYSTGELTQFRALLFKLLLAGGALGLAGFVAVRIGGVRLLTILYGREYAAHYPVFLTLILATAIHCVACMLTSAVTAARCFRIQVPLYAVITGSNALACAWWIPTGGLSGGAAAMVVAAVMHLVLGAVVVTYLLWPSTRPLVISEVRPCVDEWEASL